VKIDANKLLESLTDEEVILILEHLGVDNYKEHRNYIAFSTNICHDGTHLNLIYFRSSKSFHCFSGCGCTYSIYDLVKKVKDVSFVESLHYISDLVNRKFELEEIDDSLIIDDWKWIKKLKKKKYLQPEENVILPKEILNQYIHYPHILWVNDNIKPETQKEWEICYDLRSERICYGLYDESNNLLGVKGRAVSSDAEDKYIFLYSCNKSNILCGIHKTLPHILTEKKCLVFESFKSVMLAWQYGYKFAVSLEGSSPSEWQYRKLLELDSEIIIALDRGIENKKLREIRDRLKGKTKLSFMFDDKGLLEGEKSSPIDEGEEKFKILYESRYRVK